MPNNNSIATPASLQEFLAHSDSMYRASLDTIPLFDSNQTQHWNTQQKQHFAAIFYHLRGHFINFMWYLANFSSNEQMKQVVLNNIHEEIGIGTRFSHELLYERFATECQVNIHEEMLSEAFYLPFAREFNKKHLQWLTCHSEEERIAAFAAYERLDNLDYPLLVNLAKSLHISQQGMAFFNVHVHVTHFDSVLDLLFPIWETDQSKVKNAFEFIYTHQRQMWSNLSDAIFSVARSEAVVA
ncbi:hypothetical protein DIZ81_07130 [Legionella taurinensis]|uniref:Iron-containing redox enzyme family protein n=1 Tax=Legionella taurinensis TaxID=70611 RepID=A0A3A5LH11_9GAMM|nr:iron-containing redox enzyme family protein [Legionella taurinensis]MDX1837154.1 iron-containing redox enzyme family protein [Legionella taurinensis]PUT40369.1 hypothetical protein DB744_07130 [Legionella taurinensis]PUT40540.1 hypothetical protein DB746_11710 [Legionella taurinensis]PUT42785.1 hypothetical protein DB743_12195 [Legionella taurinensis]PUT48430.1 hypothetical protein DB745_05530 [Legionella taurinensis]